MKLELMLPKELEEAKKARVPLVIPVGTIEYHGPHCALGCDTLVCTGLLEQLAGRRELVLAPPVWYGVSSYAVGGPEQGTVHIDADVFEAYIHELLKSLLYGGFRNIYLLIHHQYEVGSLMPMTLACMKAAKKLIMEYQEERHGRGWWGSNDMKDYYDRLDAADNPFNWITVLPAMSPEVQLATGYDHAGKFETSLLWSLCPEAVSVDRLAGCDAWFVQSAGESSVQLGLRMARLCLEDLERRIV